MRRLDWIVYAKKPFGGPAQVLAYLGRYTHRVAIANSRIQACDDEHVRFTWKDYRDDGALKIMSLKPDEFIRRFLLHALPDGFHRIRHFGYLANGHRTERLALCRALLTNEADADGERKGRAANARAGRDDRAELSSLFGMRRHSCGFVARVPRGGERPRSNTSPFRCDTS